VPWLPLTALVPAHAPDAVHAVAFAELQLKVDEPPTATEVGLADSETVGAGALATVTVADRLALPPVPVQVSV